jgi:hypothetical protein
MLLDHLEIIIFSPLRHQRKYPPAQVFTRVSGVARGFRCKFGPNIFRELVAGIGFKPKDARSSGSMRKSEIEWA